MIDKQNKSFSDVAQQLNQSTYDIMNEYYSWLTQENWTDDDRDKLIQEYNKGKSIKELVQMFQNRTEIGIHSKLSVCRAQLQRPLERLSADAPLCLRTTEIANSALYHAKHNEDFNSDLQDLKTLLQDEKITQ